MDKRFIALILATGVLLTAQFTHGGRRKELHAPSKLSDNLSPRDRECWEDLTRLLQIYNNREPHMPPTFRYNFMIDGDSATNYCKWATKMRNIMSSREKRSTLNEIESRMKRAIFNFDFEMSRKWDVDEDFPLRYKFGTTGFNTNGNKENVRKAIRLIEQATCVEFREIPSDSLYQGPHIEFLRADTCVSFLGRAEVIPQPIYLSAECLQRWGDIAHEILHALGLLHTHQRVDRDEAVHFISENIQDVYAGQFQIVPEFFATTLDTEYDYTSIMHFNGKQFIDSDVNADTDYTLKTIDPLFQRTIGQRVELSFTDAYFINLFYCDHVCEGITINCLRDGYVDPKDCSQCRCPDGFSGVTCDQLSPPVQDSCGVQDLTATSSTAYVISPNYDVSWYKNWQECTWRITAPGGQVEFWFEGQFGVYCKNNDICFHWVEIRYGDSLTRNGPRFCCTDLPYGPTEDNRFLSNSTEILVLFRARWNETQDVMDETSLYRKGFKLAYRRVVAEICVGVTCSGNGVCDVTDGSCDCLPGYEGADCDQDINDCEGVVCQNGGTCVDEVNGYSCNCEDGYQGLLCEEEIDECESEPCVNNGQCTDVVGGYTCLCPAAYTGVICEQDVNECNSSPCQNGGRCQQLDPGSGYECMCPPGFFGINCELDVNECASEPCFNGATCLDQPNMYTCRCPPGYDGVNCELELTTLRTTRMTTTTTTTTITTTTTGPSTSIFGCPSNRWGDNCQYPTDCGGHHERAGPGVLDVPCNHQLCHTYQRYRTCTWTWHWLFWRKKKCRYRRRRVSFTCPGSDYACDASIGFQPIIIRNVAWCAQAGFELDDCRCCTRHCGHCSGWHRKLFYWQLWQDNSNWHYQVWNETCIKYPRKNCRY